MLLDASTPVFRFSSASRTSLAVVVTCVAALLQPAAASAATPQVHAIVGARIIPGPGQVIPHGNIVMRDGIIVAVGPAVPVPADARIWNGDSLTVYAGLIDAFVTPSAASGAAPGPRPFGAAPASTAPRGAVHELESVHPEWRVTGAAALGADQVQGLRAAGFTVAQVAPATGIVRGQSAVVGLGDGLLNTNLVRADQAQVISLETTRGTYPGSLMGAVAVIRQALLDARWYHDVHTAYDRSPQGRPRPEENLAWEALAPVIAGRQTALFMADEMLEVLRSAAIAKEAGIAAQVLGSGDEYKRAREIAATGVPLLLPVNFPEAPDVSDPATALEVSIEQLRHWNQAPGNPAALKHAGVTFALTTNGLKDVKTFRGAVVRAMGRGLRGDDALAAVTTVPARLLGLGDRLGTLAPGRIANLTVTRGDLFSDEGRVREVWVDGRRYEITHDDATPVGSWRLGWGGQAPSHPLTVGADSTATLVVGRDTLRATDVHLESANVRFTVQRGSEAPEHFDLTAKVDRLTGTLSVTGVGSHDVVGEKAGEFPSHKDAAKQDALVPTPIVMGNTEAWRAARPAQPAALLIRGATVWTAGPQGTLAGADVLVRAGRIAAVGRGLAAPKGATIVDGAGLHVAPGIIDCHNHWAILGNVNECTHNVTAEVRVQDVINSESINIYRELAGGVTTVQLLHGSCNAIGGQSAVIKFKWGEAPDQLLFGAAPGGIKFALGENPKQSNFQVPGAIPRYPQTRGGVEQLIRDAFTRARDYRDAMNEWKQGHRSRQPRRDLQLDALVEILDGRRLVHSHAYRQDELLMLMHVADDFGFKLGTFQHVLEGYKVADEMAAHGVGGSTFSDWWAYKEEVRDAIPWNGYLMWDRGVTVSYNSDDDDLARRLNTEAAKAIKYGGVPPDEAIKFVTLNPAKQLKIDARVGSIEPGKDADLSIWNGSPLSPYSRCEQTWIEGRRYFDRVEDLAGRATLDQERATLIAKAKAAKSPSDGKPAGKWPPRYLDATDVSGNDCGGGDGGEFISEAERDARRSGEVRP
jgi:imidazolonepropionase-like amidohydrolase